MRLLLRATRADAVVNYAVSREAGDAHRLIGLEVVGDRRVEDQVSFLEGRPAPRGSVAHPSVEHSRGGPIDAPPPRWVNRFVPLERSVRLDEWRRSPIWDAFYGPIHTADQLRVLIYDGGRFVRWLACLRLGRSRTPFERSALRAANASLSGLRSATIRAEAIDREVFEGGGRLVGLADASGRVTLRSDEMTRWLERDGRASRLAAVVSEMANLERVRTWVGDSAVELLRLRDGDQAEWLVTVATPNELTLSSLATLTDRQRAVAEYLAAGATVEEVARALEISPNTVKYHAKRVYDVLQVATRAELVQALNLDA